MGEVVDLRCPKDLRELLGRMKLTGEKPHIVQPGNLMELACTKCQRRWRRTNPDEGVVRVLHRFDFAGQWVEDEVVRSSLPIHHQRVSAPE